MRLYEICKSSGIKAQMQGPSPWILDHWEGLWYTQKTVSFKGFSHSLVQNGQLWAPMAWAHTTACALKYIGKPACIQVSYEHHRYHQAFDSRNSVIDPNNWLVGWQWKNTRAQAVLNHFNNQQPPWIWESQHVNGFVSIRSCWISRA